MSFINDQDVPKNFLQGKWNSRACWLIMSAHKCVTKVLTVTGFNKTVRCAMPHCKSNNSVSASKIPWTSDVKKEATLTGHPDLQIWALRTSFSGVIWKAKCRPASLKTIQGKHSCRNHCYTARDPQKGNGKRSKKGTFCCGQ